MSIFKRTGDQHFALVFDQFSEHPARCSSRERTRAHVFDVYDVKEPRSLCSCSKIYLHVERVELRSNTPELQKVRVSDSTLASNKVFEKRKFPSVSFV